MSVWKGINFEKSKVNEKNKMCINLDENNDSFNISAYSASDDSLYNTFAGINEETD